MNDLDLTVTDPTGQQFYGNDFTFPYNSSYDSTNNVEGVIINNPVAGAYNVNVSARNVPMEPQPFALVISGIGGNLTVIENQTIYPYGQTAAKNGNMITLGATVTAFKGVWNVTVNTSNINASSAKVVLDKNTGDLYINSSVVVNASDGVYKLNVTAYDKSSGKDNLTQLTVLVDNTAPASIKSLVNASYEHNNINWTWTDPSDPDFAKVMVYLDGVYKNEVLKGVQYYNAAVSPGTYTIGTKTVDTIGNINVTMTTHTATTILPLVRFINGTVMDSVNKTGISGVTVSTNTSLSATTNASGFYSFAVTSGTYDLSAKFEPMYYANNTITVSTTGSAVVAQDIELVKKLTGTITGIVTNVI